LTNRDSRASCPQRGLIGRPLKRSRREHPSQLVAEELLTVGFMDRQKQCWVVGVTGAVGLVLSLGVGGCNDSHASSPGSAKNTGAPSGTGPDASSTSPNVDSRLTINELMADNVLTTKDEQGTVSPWIELYNPTTQDLPLGGYAITDDFAMPDKAVLPASVAVPAGGYLLLWCDGNPSAGPAHLAVTLSPNGGSLALVRPDGSFIDRLTYGAQATDLSAAREPDGSNNWVTEWNVSPGAPNPSGSGQPVTPQQASDPPEAIPAAGDMSDRVLAYDLMPQFDLEISDSDIASLRAAPDTWVPATLVFEGRSYGPVGVNLKGHRRFNRSMASRGSG
jgi:hypothetical protein